MPGQFFNPGVHTSQIGQLQTDRHLVDKCRLFGHGINAIHPDLRATNRDDNTGQASTQFFSFGGSVLAAQAPDSLRFEKPGTYFVALRAISQRQGDKTTPYARIQNMDRVRVVVK